MPSTESANSCYLHNCYLIVKTPTIKSDQYDCWYGKTGIEFICENHSAQQIREDLRRWSRWSIEDCGFSYMEEPLIFSAWQAEISCDSVVVGIYGLQGLLATDPWGDSYIGCSRRVPSVHPVPGWLVWTDVWQSISKGSRTLISSNVLWLLAGNCHSLAFS